jgi:hypothetical protein
VYTSSFLEAINTLQLHLTPRLPPVSHFLLRASGVVHLGLILPFLPIPLFARPLSGHQELVCRKHGFKTNSIARRAADAGTSINIRSLEIQRLTIGCTAHEPEHHRTFAGQSRAIKAARVWKLTLDTAGIDIMAKLCT